MSNPEVTRSYVTTMPDERDVHFESGPREAVSSNVDNVVSLFGESAGELCAETILAMSERELRRINENLRLQMTDMQEQDRTIEGVNRTLQFIRAWSTQNDTGSTPIKECFDDKGVLKPVHERDSKHQVLNLNDPVVGDPPVPPRNGRATTYADLLIDAGIPEEQLGNGVGTDGNKFLHNSTSLEQLKEVIHAKTSELTQSNETRQLRLQQTVSQRSQYTQLFSQILASLNESAKAIVQNTRG